MIFSKWIGIARIRFIDLLRGTRIYGILQLLRKHQYLSKNALNEYRQKKFQELIERAKLSTKYYAAYNSYKKLPVLTKQVIRENFEDFRSRNYKKKLYKKGTGGSTGKPLIYYTTAEAQSYMWAGILLSWEAAGYNLGDKVAFIAGTSLLKSSWQHKIFYLLLNVKIYSAFTLNDEYIAEYLEDIRKNKIRIIYAYASALDMIATYIHQTEPIEFPYLKGIVSSAEVLTESMRKNIESAFKTKVFNQYGCNEAGVSAFECEHQSMHLISSRCYYESDDNDRLLSTDLSNKGFIMMKYDTGDIVEFSNENCSCKRSYPVIKNVIGRCNDTIIDVAQKVTHAAFFQILFRSDETIRQYQVVFDSKCIQINLCVDDSKDYRQYNKYMEIIKEHLLFNKYDLVFTNNFSTSENGKHKHIIDNRSYFSNMKANNAV